MKPAQIYQLVQGISNTNLWGTAKFARYLSYLLMPKPVGPVFQKNVNGFSLWVDPVEDKRGLEHDLYYLGTYEKGTTQVIATYLLPEDNFIDVGANIGFLSIFAASKLTRGKVFAFEANPGTFQILKYNVEQNNIQNIVLFNFALGAEEDTATIFPNTLENNRGGASMVKSELNKNDTGIAITVKPFDSIPNSISDFALMKIDVEGFEMEVLKGAKNLLKGKNAPALIVECSDSRNNLNFSRAELYNYIKSINDYRLYKLVKGKERISSLIEIKGELDLPFHDNLFCFLPHQLDRVKAMIIS